MSSRSSGVTKVRLSRSMIVRVRPSQACSMSLMASALVRSGGSSASICLSVRAPVRMSSDRLTKSLKNRSSRGIRLKRAMSPRVNRGIVADLTDPLRRRYKVLLASDPGEIHSSPAGRGRGRERESCVAPTERYGTTRHDSDRRSERDIAQIVTLYFDARGRDIRGDGIRGDAGLPSEMPLENGRGGKRGRRMT